MTLSQEINSNIISNLQSSLAQLDEKSKYCFEEDAEDLKNHVVNFCFSIVFMRKHKEFPQHLPQILESMDKMIAKFAEVESKLSENENPTISSISTQAHIISGLAKLNQTKALLKSIN